PAWCRAAARFARAKDRPARVPGRVPGTATGSANVALSEQRSCGNSSAPGRLARYTLPYKVSAVKRDLAEVSPICWALRIDTPSTDGSNTVRPTAVPGGFRAHRVRPVVPHPGSP